MRNPDERTERYAEAEPMVEMPVIEHDKQSMLTRAAEIGMLRTAELGLKARGLIVLAQSDPLMRSANEAVSDGDGSIRCDVCAVLQEKGQPFTFLYVGKNTVQRIVCAPCIGALMGAEEGE